MEETTGLPAEDGERADASDGNTSDVPAGGVSRAQIIGQNLEKAIALHGIGAIVPLLATDPEHWGVREFNRLHRLANPHWAGSDLDRKDEAKVVAPYSGRPATKSEE